MQPKGAARLRLTSAATTNVSGPKPMLKQNMKAQRTTRVGTALHSKKKDSAISSSATVLEMELTRNSGRRPMLFGFIDDIEAMSSRLWVFFIDILPYRRCVQDFGVSFAEMNHNFHSKIKTKRTPRRKRKTQRREKEEERETYEKNRRSSLRKRTTHCWIVQPNVSKMK